MEIYEKTETRSKQMRIFFLYFIHLLLFYIAFSRRSEMARQDNPEKKQNNKNII